MFSRALQCHVKCPSRVGLSRPTSTVEGPQEPADYPNTEYFGTTDIRVKRAIRMQQQTTRCGKIRDTGRNRPDGLCLSKRHQKHPYKPTVRRGRTARYGLTTSPRVAGQSPTETSLPSLKTDNSVIRSGRRIHLSPCSCATGERRPLGLVTP